MQYNLANKRTMFLVAPLAILIIFLFAAAGKAGVSIADQFIEIVLQTGQTRDPLAVKNPAGTALMKVDVNGNAFTKSLNATDIAATNINGVNFTDSLKEPYSYIIYASGSSYYAKNGNTGIIDYSGTNASVLINSALTQTSGSGTVFIKAGTYNINSPIILPSSGAQIKGENWMGTKLIATAAINSIIQNSGTSPHRMTIEDLTLDGNGKATYNMQLTGIVGGSIQHRLNRIHSTNSISYSLKFLDIDDTWLTNSLIENGGIYWHSGAGAWFMSNTYYAGTNSFSGQTCSIIASTQSGSITNGCSLISLNQVYFQGAGYNGVTSYINNIIPQYYGLEVSVMDSLISLPANTSFINVTGNVINKFTLSNIKLYNEGSSETNPSNIINSTDVVYGVVIENLQDTGGHTHLRTGAGYILNYYVRYSTLKDFANANSIYSNTNQIYQVAP